MAIIFTGEHEKLSEEFRANRSRSSELCVTPLSYLTEREGIDRRYYEIIGRMQLALNEALWRG